MSNEYLNNIVIDGLDETFATNKDVDDVEASIVMVVDFIIDGTGSMDIYERVMAECLEHYKNAIVNSKQADEMLVSKTIFNSVIQTGGYVSPEDLDTSYFATNWTRLFDTIVERHNRLLDYIEQLKQNGITARAAMVILSDGLDNGSTCKISDARNAVLDLYQKEITVAFIAFGQEAFGIADKLGIKPENVKEVTNDESELRKIMDLVSKSAISASKRASSGAGTTNDGGFFDV